MTSRCPDAQHVPASAGPVARQPRGSRSRNRADASPATRGRSLRHHHRARGMPGEPDRARPSGCGRPHALRSVFGCVTRTILPLVELHQVDRHGRPCRRFPSPRPRRSCRRRLPARSRRRTIFSGRTRDPDRGAGRRADAVIDVDTCRRARPTVMRTWSGSSSIRRPSNMLTEPMKSATKRELGYS